MSADGTWKVTISSPMGAQEATLTLAVDGSALTGEMAGPQGTIALTDGTADGDALTWKATIEQPMQMTLEFSAKVDGDNISGDVGLGSFGSASFSGTRV